MWWLNLSCPPSFTSLTGLVHVKCPTQCLAHGSHSTNAGPIPLPFSPELGPLMPGRDPHNLREVHQVHECLRDLRGNKGEEEHLQSHHRCPGSSLEPLAGGPFGVWLSGRCLFGRSLVGGGPKPPALLVMQKCIIHRCSWRAGRPPHHSDNKEGGP